MNLSLINIQKCYYSFENILQKVDLNDSIEFEWNNIKKSRYIESILIGLPLSAFYFDTSDDDKWQIIDGLQRLTAINEFINDKYELIDLYYLGNSIEKMTFSKLERRHQRAIEETTVTCYKIGKSTPKQVIENLKEYL